jgi:hypothetical protein
MKKILVYVLGTFALMVLWAVVILYGTVSGWFHSPIAQGNTSRPFAGAAKGELEKQFVGNFAMAILKNGDLEVESFTQKGKPWTGTPSSRCRR